LIDLRFFCCMGCFTCSGATENPWMVLVGRWVEIGVKIVGDSSRSALETSCPVWYTVESTSSEYYESKNSAESINLCDASFFN